MLEALDRGNLFLVPLDDRRRWYRYHHLFADVLRARLLDEQPDQRPGPAPAGERLVRGRTASGPSPSTTPWPPRTSTARPTWSSWRPRRCSGSGRRARCGAGWRRIPDAQFRVRPVLSNDYVGIAACPPVSSRASSRTSQNAERWLDAMSARRPRTAGPAAGHGGRGRGGVPDASRDGRRAPRRAGAGARRPRRLHRARPAGAGPRRSRRPPRASSGVGADRARVVGRRGRRGGAGGVRRVVAAHAAGRPHRRRPRTGDHAGRTSMSSRAGSATPCARTRRRYGSPRSRAGRSCGGQPTCTSGWPRCTASGTTCRPPPSSCCAARSSASTSACRRTRTAGGSRWPGSGRPKETSTARSTLLDDAERVYAGDFSPDVRPIPAMRARVLDRAGTAGRRPRLGARAGPVRRRRPQLPARVRARHPGQAAAGAVPERARRDASLDEALGLLERLLAGGRGRRPDGKRHRDPGAAGARAPAARRHRRCAGAAGARPDAGRARGLRPGLRRRGPADGGPAGGGRGARDRPGLRPAAADRLRRAPSRGRPRRPAWSSR